MTNSDSSELPDDVPPESCGDYELLHEYVKLSIEKVQKTGKFPSKSRWISGQTQRLHRSLTLARIWVAWLCLGLALLSCSGCFASLPKQLLLSAVAIMLAVMLPILLLQEFLRGAGLDVQSQFKTKETYHREFSFVPSVKTFGGLLGLLILSTISIVLGFASAFSDLSRTIPNAFSARCDALDAIYFSTVTFATVGFGDIAPSKALPRGFVIAEILISWLLLSLTFSSLTSWVVSHIQRAHNKRIADEERKMKMREAALKEAGVGLHSDSGAMMKEAKRRLEERKRNENRA